jgi:hypothetical protein
MTEELLACIGLSSVKLVTEPNHYFEGNSDRRPFLKLQEKHRLYIRGNCFVFFENRLYIGHQKHCAIRLAYLKRQFFYTECPRSLVPYFRNVLRVPYRTTFK